jgi:hypothetical protein
LHRCFESVPSDAERGASWVAGLRARARLRFLADECRNIEIWERLLATAALLEDLADQWDADGR